MTPSDFGKRISELRSEKKMTQAELAEKLNVSTQAISKWETGTGFPDIQTIPQIANIFETTADYLLGCTKKEQKLFVFDVCQWEGKADAEPRKCMKILNNQYLSKGWRIVNSQLSSEKESTYIMVIIERDA